MIDGFPPIADVSARILILGSMPSVKSLEYSEYYGHPQNAFWFIMGSLFGFDRHDPYAERCRIIKENGIAVWDVIATCERPGSLDADIKAETVQVNDFEAFLKQHQHIKTICFNGGAAEQTFKRHCHALYKNSAYRWLRLPSTSPAHASMRRAEKISVWKSYLC